MPSDFQFVGIEETLAAYDGRSLDDWALFAGNRLIMKGNGHDQLREFLQMIARSQTTAVYTLKVYDELPPSTKINSKTADDGSFNFKLFSPDGRGQFSGIIGTHYGDPVQMQILERLGALEEGGNEPEEKTILDHIGDAFIGMIQEPRKLQDFLSILTGRPIDGRGSIGNFPGVYVQPPAANVTKVSGASQPVTPFEITEQNAERISAAIQTIGGADPKIVDHLEALATMAASDPAKFKMLTGLLDAGM